MTTASDLSILQNDGAIGMSVKMNTSSDRKNGADANSVESRSLWLADLHPRDRHQQQLSYSLSEVLSRVQLQP